MSIPDHARANFATLLRAAADGNLALMECADSLTGELRFVICAVRRDGTDFVFTPFGHLADGNPFDAYVPLVENPAGRAAPLISRVAGPVWTRRLGGQRASRFRIAPDASPAAPQPRPVTGPPQRRSGGCRMCRVLNKHHAGVPVNAVYIGSGSKWGNPFRISPDGDLLLRLANATCDERIAWWRAVKVAA